MNSKVIHWLLFVLLCFIWGSSFILMKVSRQGLTPGQIASLRIFSAGVVFLPFAIFHISRIPVRKLGWVAAVGLAGNFIPAFLFASAITRIDSSLAGILNSLTPVCVVTIAFLLFRDRIKWQKILGIVIGFAGLCGLTLTRSEISLDNLNYALMILGATFSYGLSVNLVSHYLQDVKPVHVASISLMFMMVPAGIIAWQLGVFSLDFAEPVIQWSLLNTLLLGIVGSAIGTAIFYVLVQQAGAIFASVVTYGIPFVALFWGYLDGELITVKTMLWLMIILTGVYLASRREKKIPAGETGGEQ